MYKLTGKCSFGLKCKFAHEAPCPTSCSSTMLTDLEHMVLPSPVTPIRLTSSCPLALVGTTGVVTSTNGNRTRVTLSYIMKPSAATDQWIGMASGIGILTRDYIVMSLALKPFDPADYLLNAILSTTTVLIISGTAKLFDIIT